MNRDTILATLTEKLRLDHPTAERLYGNFIETLCRRMDLLHEALAHGNLREAAAEAHAIKGCAANIGAAELSAAAKALQLALLSGNGAAPELAALGREAAPLPAEYEQKPTLRRK